MLGYDDVQTLDMHTMWPGREGTRQRLTVPIGATPDGQAVYLDLKEAAHGGMGPHGLCIGATGFAPFIWSPARRARRRGRRSPPCVPCAATRRRPCG